MKGIRIISCLVILLLLCSLPLRSTNKTKNLQILADSARQMIAKEGFLVLNDRCMKLARELDDSTQIENAYGDLFDHYYQLGEVDSLKVVGYELMNCMPTQQE